MNMTIKQLESAAIEAHQAGTTWFAFWPTIAAESSANPTAAQPIPPDTTFISTATR